MKSPKILMFAIAVIALASVVAFFDVSDANAGPIQCTLLGGVWWDDGVNGTCTFKKGTSSYQTICTDQGFIADGYIAVAYYYKGFLVWRLDYTACRYLGGQSEWVGKSVEVEEDVVPGTPVDIWQGNCGAHISNPPFNGSVMLGIYSKMGLTDVPVNQVPTSTPVCKISYLDANGEELSQFGSPGWVFYNLNRQLLDKWDDDNLTVWVYQGGAWAPCSNPVKVDFGENTEDGQDEFGRLACFSSNPILFGLGYPPEE